jgi:hypothetical protein
MGTSCLYRLCMYSYRDSEAAEIVPFVRRRRNVYISLVPSHACHPRRNVHCLFFFFFFSFEQMLSMPLKNAADTLGLDSDWNWKLDVALPRPTKIVASGAM